MFAINPVLALERYGVKLTPALRDHVLRTLKNPGSAGTRRQALEASLTQAFGEAPRPENPAWLANALFKVLKLTPLDRRGYEPAYAPPLNAAILARLEPLRPKPRRKYPLLRPGAVKSSVGLTSWREKARLLDLAAPAPDLPRARQAPRTLGLEEAWFYKDRDPVAHDLVELGAIQRTGFFFHSPDSFRRIAAGEASNVFRTWIREVRFKDARR
ncbi:MAG: hypothetical protein H0X27_09055 [Caulobacteraceae bacterium]|nr:hypothetical protein [Caulobacteraceae bacterium]